MKKTISMMMAIVMLACVLCMWGCGSSAQEPENAVYITIANGELILVRQAVTLSDADGDGTMTINDALILAHNAAYDGGAKAGYSSVESEYGLSLSCLWGNTSGAYGYRVNDVSAMSLGDAVKVGDHVYAYVYVDQQTWSDVYSYFDQSATTVSAGEEFTLTLTYAGYDADWNPVTAPVADARITIDGVASEYTTEAEGKVTFTFDKKGKHVISATSEGMTLVPPVCVVTVK